MQIGDVAIAALETGGRVPPEPGAKMQILLVWPVVATSVVEINASQALRAHRRLSNLLAAGPSSEQIEA
jgi:hypothetical protein